MDNNVKLHPIKLSIPRTPIDAHEMSRGHTGVYVMSVLTRTRQVVYALITLVSFFLLLLTN